MPCLHTEMPPSMAVVLGLYLAWDDRARFMDMEIYVD